MTEDEKLDVRKKLFDVINGESNTGLARDIQEAIDELPEKIKERVLKIPVEILNDSEKLPIIPTEANIDYIAKYCVENFQLAI